MRAFRCLLPLLLLLAGCARRAPVTDQTAPPDAGRPAVDAATIQARIDQALALRAAGKQDKGIALLEQTRLDALDAHLPALATLALNRRGDLANDLGKKAEAKQDYEAAYAEAAQRNDYAAMGRAAHDRALVNADVWGAGDPEALTWYPRAVDARRKAGDLVGVRRSANNLAIQYFYGNRKDEALHWYAEALEAGESASDWDGVYKIHANLALLHAVHAEGAFAPGAPLRAWVPPLKLDPAAEALAREHYAKGIEAAAKIGRGEDDVCGVFGNYGARCARLSPGSKPGEGLVAFFAQLALEAESSSQDEAQLQAGLLCLRAADAAREAGPTQAAQIAVFEKSARDHLGLAAAPAGSVEAYCKGEPLAAELCARLQAPEKKRKPRAPKS